MIKSKELTQYEELVISNGYIINWIEESESSIIVNIRGKYEVVKSCTQVLNVNLQSTTFRIAKVDLHNDAVLNGETMRAILVK
jgi:hypothetical protein